eukprot:TRINITY_DN708_c0_g1_i1.p1 TRINITY_DN708_c0_g1~~TRINITY_DN708_c0_g1_i1.p1  ORF type:complete len:983 (+),score=162.61 TRINITY_DN708_c0_g1_i1:135-3083(+)
MRTLSSLQDSLSPPHLPLPSLAHPLSQKRVRQISHETCLICRGKKNSCFGLLRPMGSSTLFRWHCLSTLALLLLLLLAHTVASAPLCVPRDRSALLAFKAGLVDNGNQLGSWTSNGNCCLYKGVTCNVKGEVTNVTFEAFVEDDCDENCTLIESKASGTNSVNLIGTTLSKLLSLEVLNLTNFFLRDVTPTGLSALKSLKILGLQITVLHGPLSPDIGKISSLQYLSLGPGNYEVSGTIPASFCQLANLQTLILTEREFTVGAKSGGIPSCFNQLKKLQVLNLDYNQFTGRIPASIKQLPNLKVFSVTKNNLTGSLPGINSGELPLLEVLHLEGNNFVGSIPPSFGNLLSLKELRIGGLDDGTGSNTFIKSKISGSIPATLGNLKKLQVLVIQATAVSGVIPTSLAPLPLTDLVLAKNNLNGPIPANLGANGLLVIVSFSDNSLTGTIPASLGGANKKLFTFDAARNSLSGTIPDSFALLKLNELDLSFNQLSGEIPKNLGFAISQELRNLYLNNNQLTGPLNPASLWGVREVVLSHNKLTSLGTGGIPGDGTAGQGVQLFDVHTNQLAGPIPQWVFQLTNALLFDLSDNKLTKLPVFDGSKFTASYINISANVITGTIPQAFTLNNGLNVLDLHRNQFTGSIPTGFGSGVAGFINVLNFAENQLTGPIPTDIFNGGFTNALIFNKNKLSGPIPQRPPNNDFLNYVDFSDNELTGPFPTSIVTASFFLQKLKLSNNKLSGPIPDFTGACPNLQALIVENNQLTGPLLPAGVDFSSCSSLAVFDVSGNLLSGSIPSAITSFTSLKVLDVSRNAITGSVPASLASLHSLVILDLSTNKLTGGLPLQQLVSGFTALKVAGNASNYVAGAPLYIDAFFFPESTFFIRNIEYLFTSTSVLDVSGNTISGAIDPAVGQLKGLNFLDLSHNKFSGAVPASIAQITDLDALDLSFNALTGPIPSALKNFPAADFAGNPGLCGPPLSNKCP